MDTPPAAPNARPTNLGQAPGVPINVVREGTPSRTALVVARLRAAHQWLDVRPVLCDPVALPLLGEAEAAALRSNPSALNDPLSRGLRAAVVARSRFVEDRVAQNVATGTRQYVVLGAGLDTFAYRHPFGDAGLRVFEVDHPGTQRWKRQLLSDAGITVPPSLAFVPLDIERDNLLEALRDSGFRTDRAAVVGWMGVTMYLTEDTVLRTAQAMAALAPGSCLCFDYHVLDTALGDMDRLALEILRSRAAALGEPWVSKFDPARLETLLLDLGFRSTESVSGDELNERYFAQRSDGLRTGGVTRILCAST